MTEFKQMLQEKYHQNKLEFLLQAAWVLTVISSFMGSAVLSVRVPAIGELFPFRIFLPITFVLYLISVVKKRENLWKLSRAAEKACIVFMIALLVHSVISIPTAIDVSWSFRRLFNLSFDFGFFFLMLFICRQREMFCLTMKTCFGAFWVLSILGVWETFFGHIFYAGEKAQVIKLFGLRIWSPMVSFANTNDYMSAVTFLFAALFLCWVLKKKKTRKDWGQLFAASVVAFYLAQCASARLLVLVLWILLFAIAGYALLTKGKKAAPILLVVVVFVAMTAFAQMDIGAWILNPSGPSTENNSQGNGGNTSLKDEFFQNDDQTGELQLNTTSSAGIRARLIIHAFQCFFDSKGMGVGIGDTEQLAKVEKVAKDGDMWSIHCFVARLLGDYGIWAFIPLCYIVVELISHGLSVLKQGWKRKDREACGFAALYCIVAMTYVITSTSSSDAQDILPMWIFLAVIVLLGRADVGSKPLKKRSAKKYVK